MTDDQIKKTIRTKPPGFVFTLQESDLPALRNAYRNVRQVKTRLDLKTGRRTVKLGEFIQLKTT